MKSVIITLALVLIALEACTAAGLAQRFCDFTDPDRATEEQPRTQHERFKSFGYEPQNQTLTFLVSPSEYMCGKR
jgi:hypothetical protein